MKSCPFANIKIIKVAKGNLFKILSVPVVRIIITRRLHKHEQFLCCWRGTFVEWLQVLLFGCISFPLQVASSLMRCQILVSDATLGKSTSFMPLLDCPNCSHFIFLALLWTSLICFLLASSNGSLPSRILSSWPHYLMTSGFRAAPTMYLMFSRTK